MTTIGIGPVTAVRAFIAESPSMPGRRTSITTMSGARLGGGDAVFGIDATRT